MCSEGAAGDADGERWESRIGWVLIAGVRTCGITGDLKFFLYVLRLWDVNCNLVYQVDRLNRFLPDFSRIVDLPDRHRATFAAVTLVQPHLLARRLKLNILLSFAHGNQFHWLLLPKVPLVLLPKVNPPKKGVAPPHSTATLGIVGNRNPGEFSFADSARTCMRIPPNSAGHHLTAGPPGGAHLSQVIPGLATSRRPYYRNL